MKILFQPHSFRFVPRLLCAGAFSLLFADGLQAQSPGDRDTSFADGTQASGPIYALALQANNQAIVGGAFTTFRGASRNAIARLKTDGTLDAFSPGLAFSGYNGTAPSVQAVAVQADGKILAAGSFTVLNQSGGGGVVRLTASGGLDSSFNAGSGVVDNDGTVGTAYAVVVLPSQKILVGGAFTSFNGTKTAGLVRLNTNGTVDTTFNPAGAGITGNDYGLDVRSIVVQADGKIVIGGHFSTYDGHTANSVARLESNGTFDTTFDAGEGVDDGGVLALALQSDDKVLVGGDFNDFDGIDTSHLVRLNTDGSLDTGFDPGGSLIIESVDSLIVQPDASILAGGVFAIGGGLVTSPHNGLTRYLSDGTQDTSFDSGTDDRQVTGVALQSDGKAVAVSIPYSLTGPYTGDAYRYYDLFFTAFFDGQVSLGSGVYYLSFSNGNYFGYYEFLSEQNYIYHYDLGFEYVFDAADGHRGVYFYDFKSKDFFYTSPTFPFPYLYDFNLKTFLYYYPDPKNAGHYNTDGVRYFYDFATGKIISK